MDNRKLTLAAYILGSIIVWFYARSIVEYVYVNFYQIRRLLAGAEVVREALPLVFAGGAFVILLKHPKVNSFMDEVVTELKKVTWPGRPDVVRSTTVVIICIMIASVILASFDVVWGRVMSWALS